MSIDNDRFTTLVDAALKSNKLVTETASNRIKDLLKGRISEQPLRTKELGEIANELISDMTTPAKPSAKENQ
jgi:hypothetical protein